MFVFSYGSGEIFDNEFLKIILNNFDFRFGVIIRDLDLRKFVFKEISVFGYFKFGFSWEVLKILKV